MTRIKQKEIKIAVIGLGYVGLPLAVEFSKIYPVVGFDLNQNRINELKTGLDKNLVISKARLILPGKLSFTFNQNELKSCNVYIVTVPTPIDEFNKPVLSPITSATSMIGSLLAMGDVVIYESTVYPGATEEVCVPILEQVSSMKYKKEFFCGYSPERINPGDKEHTLTTIIKVTSGSDNITSEFVDSLYKSIIPAGTHKASSMAVAEAAKVIENTQRDLNIALINELSLIFNKLKLDTEEVLQAAGTKWNFLPFRPGLVGGHCIGVDPYYLTHKALEIGYNPEIILAGRRLNDSMGKIIAENTINQMEKSGINPKESKVAIFGLTFKENCPDLRNTKVLNIINHLKEYGCKIVVTDDCADPQEAEDFYGIKLKQLNSFQSLSAVILAVGHDVYKKISLNDWKKMIIDNGVIVDVKSIYRKDFFLNTSFTHWRL